MRPPLSADSSARLRAEILPDNEPVLALLHAHGADLVRSPNHSVAMYDVLLRAGVPAAKTPTGVVPGR